MKKLMTMVSAMMMVAAVNASEVATVAFNEARVNVPARVRFVKGDNYGFSKGRALHCEGRCVETQLR